MARGKDQVPGGDADSGVTQQITMRSEGRQSQLASWRKTMNEKGLEGVLRQTMSSGIALAGPAVQAKVLGISAVLGATGIFTIVWGVLAVGVSVSVANAIFEAGRTHEEPKVRKASAWGGSIADAYRESNDAFQEFLRRARNPEARESLRDSLDAAMRALSPEVAIALGNLGRTYADAGQGPDPFFAKTVELLTLCSPQVFRSLQLVFVPFKDSTIRGAGRVQLLPQHASYPLPGTFIPTMNTPISADAQELFNSISLVFRESPGNGHSASTHQMPITEPLFIPQILIRCQLAWAVEGGASIDLGDGRRLAEILGPPPA